MLKYQTHLRDVRYHRQPLFLRDEVRRRIYDGGSDSPGATVRAMVQAGWHTPDATWPTGRIGLITWEDNQYQYAMEKGFLAALAAAGLKETDVRYVAVPQSAMPQEGKSVEILILARDRAGNVVPRLELFVSAA